MRGTFASVMLLGLFLLLSWIGVFVLFMVRG
ncbi:cytochrome c oxidase subunit 2A [Paenibacillus ehimensis]|nr:cytochrome c oxidase subunit 2A [Paenibacillus ehimensis]